MAHCGVQWIVYTALLASTLDMQMEQTFARVPGWPQVEYCR